MSNSLPAAHERISKLDAIALIANRVKRPGESLRAASDKVRKRIDYAIRNGPLPRPDASGFVFGQLIAWAVGLHGWRQALAGLPAINDSQSNLVIPMQTSSGRVLSLPTSLEACHAALVAADALIAELECRNAEIEAEVRRLQPFEIRRKKMRSAGKRGGRGNAL